MTKATGRLGGPSNKGPSEEADTGFSRSVATVIDVLSEGPIEGLIGDPARAIYIDNTPLENPNGTRNFKGVVIRERKGLAAQPQIPDLDEITQETAVNTEVKKNQPITRTIINDQLDAIRIRIGVQLQENKSNGDIEGSEVEFRVLIREGNGAFRLRATRTIKGRYSGLTEFEMQFAVGNQNGTIDSFQVRIEKVTDDSNSQSISRTLRWQSYSEIIRARLTYKSTALVNLDFNAEQFNSVPVRSYRVGGLRCRIPTNATVRADRSLQFTGIWDGNFYVSPIAINDPVWQLYEILTNKRWGLGVYIDELLIDKWSLYDCSVYNNQLITNPLGGTEPRFRCSTVLNTKEKAYDVINALCSSCNMKPFWADGVVQFWQDRPTPVTAQFTNADVEQGKFSYSRSALRTRFTTVQVVWNDPDDFYKQAIEVVDDDLGAARFGVRETDFVAYGCFSRGQAVRAGRHFLFTSLYEPETVSFVAKANAAFLRPGEVVQIMDRDKANIEYGGLVIAAGFSVPNNNWFFHLDRPVRFPANGTFSYTTEQGLHTLAILNPPGSISNFCFVPPPPVAHVTEANWVIQAPSIAAPQYRIIAIEPDSQNPTKVNVTAIQYTAGKYAKIENNIAIAPLPVRITAPTVVNTPNNVVASISTISSGNGTFRKLRGTWSTPVDSFNIPDQFITGYFVEYKRGENGIWEGNTFTQNTFAEFDVGPFSRYYVRVAAVDVNNKTSFWVESAPLDFDAANLRTTFNRPQSAIIA